MIPREWESGDTYGMNTRPIAFADFRDPRAQQYVHERVRSSRVLRARELIRVPHRRADPSLGGASVAWLRHRQIHISPAFAGLMQRPAASSPYSVRSTSIDLWEPTTSLTRSAGKKELVEYEQCTEGGDPALASACTEYQGALNSCMAKVQSCLPAAQLTGCRSD